MIKVSETMKERDKSLDVLRILSMFLVIVIHLSNYYCRRIDFISSFSYFSATFFNAIARISVPIFFMISGALLIPKIEDLKKYKSRVIKFVLLLLVWTIIYFIWNKFYMQVDLHTIKDLVQSIYIPIKNHLWFMYAIIGLYIALPFIRKMVMNLDEKEEKLFVILWLVLSGGFYIFSLILRSFGINTTITYLTPIINGTYYLGYFIVGYLIYKRNDLHKFKKYNKKILCLAIISLLITFFGTNILSLINDKYYEGFFAYRSLFIVITSLSTYLLVMINKDKLFKKGESKLINTLSATSFGIYLFHAIPFNILTENINILNIPAVIGIPLLSLGIFLVSFVIIYLLKKIPFIKEYL